MALPAAACNSVLGITAGVAGAGGSMPTTTTTTTTTASTSATTTTTTTTTTAHGTGGMGGSTGTGGTGGSVTLPLAWPLAMKTSASEVSDGSAPWETDTITITRAPNAQKLVLASTPDGTGKLVVDDNVHLVVTPQGGTPKEVYYEFWNNYPCPAQSIVVPPGGDGSGGSQPIDITTLFSTSTTTPQQVKLEFWHCANHPPSHDPVYLVEM